jgi:putative RNA 2'-phosphotransferase
MKKNIVKYSKFLSLILRHQPEIIGLSLDENGWAEVSQLIELANKQGTALTPELLEEVVATNDKKRFAFNADKSRIRASQGHSIAVDLALVPQQPPAYLFHGTATRFLDSIRDRGLLPGSRQHVHLSEDESIAKNVGQRHGKPIVLKVRSGEMAQAGTSFFLSDNGVWLTDNVPSQYLDFPDVI